MPRAVNVTTELLQAGHAELEQRYRWGCSFEEVMAHPVRSRLVRAMAVGICLQRRQFTKAARRKAAATQARTQALRHRLGIDGKAAAAGEQPERDEA